MYYFLISTLNKIFLSYLCLMLTRLYVCIYICMYIVTNNLVRAGYILLYIDCNIFIYCICHLNKQFLTYLHIQDNAKKYNTIPNRINVIHSVLHGWALSVQNIAIVLKVNFTQQSILFSNHACYACHALVCYEVLWANATFIYRFRIV